MIQPATWAVRGKDYFIVRGILFKANEVSELPVQSSVSEHVVISYTQVRVRKARGAMGPGLRPAAPSSPWNGEAVHTRWQEWPSSRLAQARLYLTSVQNHTQHGEIHPDPGHLPPGIRSLTFLPNYDF